MPIFRTKQECSLCGQPIMKWQRYRVTPFGTYHIAKKCTRRYLKGKGFDGRPRGENG